MRRPPPPHIVLLCCSLAACSDDTSAGADSAAAALDALRVVTFNTGTTEGLNHDAGPDDGYTSEHALTSDTWYGDGLAWTPAVDAATAWFADVDADVVLFQEIFYAAECAEIPDAAHADFICERYQPGDPTVAAEILGPDYQVACHLGKPDKCVAVHQRVGRFAGCDGDVCLDGLDGGDVDGCGSGSRVGRGRVERVDGGADFTLVSVHGSSGLMPEDAACRARQVEQIFVDLGDGAPAANGDRNLVGGDLNTDPGRWADFDESAARWLDFVGPDHAVGFISAVGADAPGSYQGVADIDHVMADDWVGSCVHAGLDDALPGVIDARYFDHLPVVCELR